MIPVDLLLSINDELDKMIKDVRNMNKNMEEINKKGG